MSPSSFAASISQSFLLSFAEKSRKAPPRLEEDDEEEEDDDEFEEDEDGDDEPMHDLRGTRRGEGFLTSSPIDSS